MKSAIRNWFGQFDHEGKLFLAFAIAAFVVDAMVCFKYGLSLTFWHGAGFVITALAFMVVPDKAYEMFSQRKYVAGLVLAAACVPIGYSAFQAHMGYSAGIRLADLQQTGVQNTKYEDARGEVTDNVANVKMWKEHLEKLTAENAWATTISADGLKEQAKTLQVRIDEERNNRGCKAKCRALMDEKLKLDERIAIAERAQDLTSKIEATQRKIDEARAKSAGVAKVSSVVENQNLAGAQLFKALSGASADEIVAPDAQTQMIAQILNTGNSSIVFMILAPIFWFLAGRNKLAGARRVVSSDARQSLEVARTEATAERRLSIREAMETGLLALPRAA